MLLNFKSTCLVIFLIVDITERIPKKKEAPFHFDLIWAFLGCVFGSIQIVLDSSFTIVGSPFWESCLVPLWVGCVLLPFFGCHFWVPFTVRPSLSSDTLLLFAVFSTTFLSTRSVSFFSRFFPLSLHCMCGVCVWRACLACASGLRVWRG